MSVKTTLNKDYSILVKICICSKNTLHESYWKNFYVRTGTSRVYGVCYKKNLKTPIHLTGAPRDRETMNCAYC